MANFELQLNAIWMLLRSVAVVAARAWAAHCGVQSWVADWRELARKDLKSTDCTYKLFYLSFFSPDAVCHTVKNGSKGGW